MPKFKSINFTCQSAFAIYLAYGDSSPLIGNEVELMDNFIDNQLKSNNGAYAMYEFNDESYYGYCEITGLYGNVIDVTMTMEVKE
jgi:hypothetical protein